MIIEIMLYISLGWLFITSIVLLRNYVAFSKLIDMTNTSSNQPLVSICIPARNEEAVIQRCVESILKQTYKNYELLVLNDQSEDKTGDILNSIASIHSNMSVFSGAPKPPDWLGKPWACHQLSEKAKGDILVFIDADTWWDPHALTHIVQAFDQHKLDALTVWPQQHCGGFWEHTVIPMIYHALNALLPVELVHKEPSWIPSSLQNNWRTSFAAACGQCLAFTRTCYDSIAGHESVKNEVVEDVQLAKHIRQSNYVLRMYNGVGSIHCRMYTSEREIWNGLRKNFLAGFNNNLVFFFLAATLHTVVYIIPIAALIIGLMLNSNLLLILSTLSISLTLIQRLVLRNMFKFDIRFIPTHFIAVLWFQFLGIRCIIDRLFNLQASWKGRSV